MRNAHAPSRWDLHRYFMWTTLLLLVPLSRPVVAGGMQANAALLAVLSQQYSAIESLGSAGGTWLLHDEGLRLEVSRARDAELDAVYQQWQSKPLERRAHPSPSLKQLSKTIRSQARTIATRSGAEVYEITKESLSAQFMFRNNCIQSAIIAVRQDASHWTVFTVYTSVIEGPQKPNFWQSFSGNTVASRFNPSGQVMAKIVTTKFDAQAIALSYLGQGWHQAMPEESFFSQAEPLVFRRGASVVTVAASPTPNAETLVLLIKGE